MKTHCRLALLTVTCLLMLSGCGQPNPAPAHTPAVSETAPIASSPTVPAVTASLPPLTPTLTLLPQATRPAPTSQAVTQGTPRQDRTGSAPAAVAVTPSATALTAHTAVPTPCSQPWLVENPPDSRCPSTTTETEAAAQRFEHGIMVWLKDPGMYVIALDARVLPEWRQTWVFDPLTIYRDTSDQYTPPTRLYAPQSGFGLVWRGDVSPDGRGYKDLLGWALEPEVGYQGVLQTAYYSADHYVRYASTPFGVKLSFVQSIQTWFVGDL